MPPKMWTEVIRPALSDREGFMIAIGTPAGHNAFFDLYNHGLHDDNWFTAKFKASETKVVKEEELAEAKKLMPPEIYEQNMNVVLKALQSELYTTRSK